MRRTSILNCLVAVFAAGSAAAGNIGAASNGGYHYFGSAKCLGQIGRAFAGAMLEMGEENGQRTPRKIVAHPGVGSWLM